MIGVVAAMAAALAWTTASGLWRSLSDQGSALQLNTLKNGLATLLFVPVLALLPWQDNAAAIGWLMLSGGVGIAAGDSFYLATLRRLGTRRTLTLEALGPVLASLGSVVLMGEQLNAGAWLGALLVAGAVVLVANSDGPLHRDRQGLVFGLLAVLCGLSGAFLARQVLISSELTPLQTAAVRLLGGWLALLPILRARGSRFEARSGSGLRILLATALGTNVGIVLQQLVFQTMPVGPGVTLMSTAPVVALVVGRFEGDPIQPRGVLAAVLAVAGVACSA